MTPRSAIVASDIVFRDTAMLDGIESGIHDIANRTGQRRMGRYLFAEQVGFVRRSLQLSGRILVACIHSP